MTEIFVLVALVWNGGQGPNGVLNQTKTYDTELQCEIGVMEMEAQIKDEWPGHPFLVYCESKTFDLSVEA